MSMVVNMNLQLGDVQETALIPLAVRANETKRRNARINDKKAVEVIETLKVDTKDIDKFFSHEGVVARTIMFDRTLKNLLELDSKLELIRESSFWDEMKKYTLIGKIGSVIAKDLNNRLAVYRWGN